MKIILPHGDNGVYLGNLPPPAMRPNAALCRMTHSLISAGTERGMIRSVQGKSRKEIIQTGMRLGYSGAGIVERVGADLPGFRRGQRVAFYGGPYVYHGERVVVPRHLLFPMPDGLEPSQAAFIGLAAISLHGFRQGAAGLGDVCFVAGAGIIGNLCAQLALLAGCRVVVSDPDASRRARMRKCAAAADDFRCVVPAEVEEAVRETSRGRGADTVLLCLSTTTAEAMEQALRVLRPGGRIVVVGVLDVHVPRDLFFQREAEITISRAAGPGRYDPGYERDGVDYPLQYVRWTEGRNCEESLRLIAAGRLRVKPLLGRLYPVQHAAEAYEAVLNEKSDMGHLLDWTTLSRKK